MTAIRDLVCHWEDSEVCPVGLDETILRPFFRFFWGQVDNVYPLVIFLGCQKIVPFSRWSEAGNMMSLFVW